ncbi:hypothetical protein [Streptomyces sp. NBC_00328]|uniref:hypothetical protein n=1 Tax=Streptomyces sp. NBC_00328 TaxID=2903646 RepID=UPI002E27CAB2|nr:hypothetical protein [Streptomyces sp. NBC_00328]
MTETAHATGRPGSGTGPFREGSAVHIPGRLDAEDDERIPPDEVCLSLHSLELANLGVRRALVHEQVEMILGTREKRGHPYCMWLAILTLLYTGDLVSAHSECRQLAMDARWLGSPRHEQLLTLMRARVSLLAGDGVKSAALLREALARGLPKALTRLAAAWLVEAHVLEGDTGAAHKVLLAHELAGRLDPNLPDVAYVLNARGALHMATGRFQPALDDFVYCGRVLIAQSVSNPAVVPWRSRAAFAALATRRHDLALALATDELTAARTWGAPPAASVSPCTPWPSSAGTTPRWPCWRRRWNSWTWRMRAVSSSTPSTTSPSYRPNAAIPPGPAHGWKRRARSPGTAATACGATG